MTGKVQSQDLVNLRRIPTTTKFCDEAAATSISRNSKGPRRNGII